MSTCSSGNGGAAVAAQQEERARHMLERRDGARVQARGGLEELQALEHAALLAPQQALDDERVLAERAVRVQLLLDHRLARRVLAAQVQQVHEPALVRRARRSRHSAQAAQAPGARRVGTTALARLFRPSRRAFALLLLRLILRDSRLAGPARGTADTPAIFREPSTAATCAHDGGRCR